MNNQHEKNDAEYRHFEAALAAFVCEEQPCHTVARYSDEATDEAWALARKHGPTLWGEMK